MLQAHRSTPQAPACKSLLWQTAKGIRRLATIGYLSILCVMSWTTHDHACMAVESAKSGPALGCFQSSTLCSQRRLGPVLVGMSAP